MSDKPRLLCALSFDLPILTCLVIGYFPSQRDHPWPITNYTAGLVESNSSLLASFWLMSPLGLTAKKLVSALSPALIIEYGTMLLFTSDWMYTTSDQCLSFLSWLTWYFVSVTLFVPPSLLQWCWRRCVLRVVYDCAPKVCEHRSYKPVGEKVSKSTTLVHLETKMD